MDGILLIDKKKGFSSFNTVQQIKRILKPNKIGHAGTLDPFATGLLIVLINQGTKLFNFIMSANKLYRATIYLGIETDTFDCTGKVIAEKEVPNLDENLIKKILNRFIGIIEQTPPLFSAIKYKGTRAYKLARKGVNFELKKRSVYIHNTELIHWNFPELTVDITCSPGTYIRSLAVDIGKAFNTCAHLKELRRISCGNFHVKDAIVIEDKITEDFLQKKIISLPDALPEFKTVYVDDAMAWRLRSGMQPQLMDKIFGQEYIKFVKDDELVAIAKIGKKGRVKLERVFY